MQETHSGVLRPAQRAAALLLPSSLADCDESSKLETARVTCDAFGVCGSTPRQGCQVWGTQWSSPPHPARAARPGALRPVTEAIMRSIRLNPRLLDASRHGGRPPALHVRECLSCPKYGWPTQTTPSLCDERRPATTKVVAQAMNARPTSAKEIALCNR